MGARRTRHVPPPSKRAKRDRGVQRDGYNLRGTVTWPTMADGQQWTAVVRRVTHVDRPAEEVGTIHTPELVDGVWTAVVDWDRVGRHAAVSARHPLDSLLPA